MNNEEAIFKSDEEIFSYLYLKTEKMNSIYIFYRTIVCLLIMFIALGFSDPIIYFSGLAYTVFSLNQLSRKQKEFQLCATNLSQTGISFTPDGVKISSPSTFVFIPNDLIESAVLWEFDPSFLLFRINPLQVVVFYLKKEEKITTGKDKKDKDEEEIEIGCRLVLGREACRQLIMQVGQYRGRRRDGHFTPKWFQMS